MEPLEWLGQENRKFDLHLVSSQPKTKLHSQLDHGKVSRNAKIKGREPVLMCQLEADKRNLCDGDVVRIYNDRGACLAGLVVDDNIMPGVAQMCTGAWYDPQQPGTPGTLCKHGNPNMLTPDKGTSSLGQGPIAHTCLVEIEKFEGDPPPVTAFEPPQILQQSE
jgi:biotin/methionine sulfoxide reductase